MTVTLKLITFSLNLTFCQILARAKKILLKCATPESIVRHCASPINAKTANDVRRTYFEEQCHDNIFDFLQQTLVMNKPKKNLFLQVIKCSNLCANAC
jgi:hypothetical protein